MKNVEVKSARKSFDNKNFVLNGLNLEVHTSSIYGLIGPSGCGKTTLLSCILGMKQLESGTIKVFGEEVSYKKPSKFSHIIGYMPQEIGLIPELTIKETLLFFGNIFQMNSTLMMERFVMICDLLELNDVDKCIKQLSGGEKRRVSLGAALIHEPQILILDEPTVGLDSMLREKIWTYLIKTTKTSNLSVIITTHYIAEAERSDCCGFMSNGILLAEGHPRNILRQFNVPNLEEAFLSLCITNYDYNGNQLSIEKTNDVHETMNLENNLSKKHDYANDNISKRKHFRTQTIKALLNKELIRICRQPSETFFVFFFPILASICSCLAIGKNPSGFKIGIVNNEIENSNFCSEYLKSTNYIFSNNSCYFENLSCYFLNEIKDETAIKVYYDSFDAAFHDAKAGIVYGFITITSNFTEVMTERKINWVPLNPSNDTIIEQIGVYIDQSDLIGLFFLRHRLYKAFERFNKKLLQNCDLNENLEDAPLRMETPYYGNFEDDYVVTMLPGMIVQAISLSGILFSISAIGQNRSEGIWNRTILSGVTVSEILLAQSLILLVYGFIQIFILKVITAVSLDLEILGNQWLLGIFFLLLYITGSVVGLLISIQTSNMLVLNCAGIVIFLGCITLCGGMWPIESQYVIVQCVSYFLPTTLSSFTSKNIIAKGFGLSHPTVYGGFIMLCSWIIAILLLSFLSLKKKKFAE